MGRWLWKAICERPDLLELLKKEVPSEVLDRIRDDLPPKVPEQIEQPESKKE